MPAKKKVVKRVSREAKPSKRVAELTVERKPLSMLKPHPRNPRIHPKPGSEEWEVLRKSLAHDYFDPIVWNKRNGMLVSGHLRRKVLRADGVTEADVVVVDYDEPTHLARLLAANKSTGVDDPFKLGEVMFELGAVDDFELALTGFTLAEIDDQRLGGEADDGEEGSGPQKEDDPRLLALVKSITPPRLTTKRGECWRLGRHYLICASITREAAIWTPILTRAIKANGKKALFVACPDPYLALTDQDVVLVMVQPDKYVAGHILSNFSDTFPDETLQKTTV